MVLEPEAERVPVADPANVFLNLVDVRNEFDGTAGAQLHAAADAELRRAAIVYIGIPEIPSSSGVRVTVGVFSEKERAGAAECWFEPEAPGTKSRCD